MAEKVSYLSRFTMKFVEILGAGIATALSGYLIAHLGGFLTPSVHPSAIQVAPSADRVFPNLNARPAEPVSADVSAQRLTLARDVSTRPARAHENSARTVAARKHRPAETSGAENKSRDAQSVEAQVRAALADVDASRAPSPEPSLQAAATPTVSPAGEPRPQLLEISRPTSGAGAPKRAADRALPPVQQAPIQVEPLTAVEIKSRPIAGVEAVPQPAPAASAHANTTEDSKGLLSAISKIPELLRTDPTPAPPGEAPRPPMPVGQ